MLSRMLRKLLVVVLLFVPIMAGPLTAQVVYGVDRLGTIYSVARAIPPPTNQNPPPPLPQNLARSSGIVTGMSPSGASDVAANPANSRLRILDVTRRVVYEVNPTGPSSITASGTSATPDCPQGAPGPCVIRLSAGVNDTLAFALANTPTGVVDRLYYAASTGQPAVCDIREHTVGFPPSIPDTRIGIIDCNRLPIGLVLNPTGDTLFFTNNVNPKSLFRMPIGARDGQSTAQPIGETIPNNPSATCTQGGVSGLVFVNGVLYGSAGNLSDCLAIVSTSDGSLTMLGQFHDSMTATSLTGLTSVASADYYVRDWTNSMASHDNGEEPSTNPFWWITGDVWNRHDNTPGAFVDDRPALEPAQNGASNFAFVRVHRKAIAPVGTGQQTVQATFLFADYGLDVPYELLPQASAGAALLRFSELEQEKKLTDLNTDPPVQWSLPNIRSTHICLAVEIFEQHDRDSQDLLTMHPGVADEQQLIVDHNNKAQVNMDVPLMTIAPVSLSSFAIVHNAALVTRDISVQYEVPAEVFAKVKGSRLRLIGQGDSELLPKGAVTLKNLSPGENRWIGVALHLANAKVGESLPIHIEELDGTRVVNGITTATRVSTLPEVIERALEMHRAVYNRADKAFHTPNAYQTSQAAGELLKNKAISEKDYLRFLSQNRQPMKATLEAVAKENREIRGFDLPRELAAIENAVELGKAADAANAHASFLDVLDAAETMVQKSEGDPADFLQMVEWQEQLYRGMEPGKTKTSNSVVEESRSFVSSVIARKSTVENYPELLRSLLPAFHATSQTFTGDLAPRVTALEKALESKNLSSIEKAHREFLLQLSRILGSRG